MEITENTESVDATRARAILGPLSLAPGADVDDARVARELLVDLGVTDAEIRAAEQQAGLPDHRVDADGREHHPTGWSGMPCNGCGAGYVQCTDEVLAGNGACCSKCRLCVTHQQREPSAGRRP